MKISKRELILLIILVVLGTGVILYRYVYAAKTAEAVKLESELEANRVKLTKLTVKQDEDEKNIQKIRKIDSDIMSIERKVPYIKDMPGMLVDMYYLITENKLEGKDIAFSGISDGGSYSYFTISFEVSGVKDNIDDFLKELENFKREISISSISFTVVGKDLFNVKLDLKVYMLKDSQPHKEPTDYDFMEGRYGNFKDLYDMFKSSGGQEAGTVNNTANPGG